MAFKYFSNIVTDGLLLYIDAANIKSYPGSGTIWSDLSRGGNNGTLTNGPTFNSGNRGSIVFDGVDDYVDFGNNNSFTNPNGFSISAWFKPASYSGGSPLLEKYQSSGYEFVFGTLSDNVYGWVYDNNTDGYRGRYFTGISSYVPLNTWGNFVYTYDGQGLTSSSKIYINTIQRDNIDFSGGSFTTIQNTSTTLTLGGYNPGLGGPINGSVSILSFYNRPLSSTEIIQNYNVTKGRYGL
jgi:hypothetical protein